MDLVNLSYLYREFFENPMFMMINFENAENAEKLRYIRTFLCKKFLEIDPTKIANDHRYISIMNMICDFGDKLKIENKFSYSSTDEAIECELERNEFLKKQKKHMTFPTFLNQFYLRCNNFCRITFADGKFSDNAKFKKLWHAIKHNVKIMQEEAAKFENRVHDANHTIEKVNDFARVVARCDQGSALDPLRD